LVLTLIIGAVSASSVVAQAPDLSPLDATFNEVVRRARGKVGVTLIHLESGRLITIRGDDQFPMASVVKLPIAIELLKQVSEKKMSLDRELWLDTSDIRPCCTLSRRHPRGGVALTVRELLELMMIESDNTAADTVLKLVGGPAVVQKRLRAMGFTTIHVNRYEGQLLLDMAGVSGAPPSGEWTLDLQRRLVAEVSKDALNLGRAQYLTDQRDTATPYESALLLGRLYLGNLLPSHETNLLVHLMAHTTTGAQRIRARLPADSFVPHKTGTTAIIINDAGVIRLPADSAIKGHIVLVVYVADGSRLAAMERMIAQLSTAAFEFFTGKSLPEPPVRRPLRKVRQQAPARHR
jgi:beta-lactamase class A